MRVSNISLHRKVTWLYIGLWRQLQSFSYTWKIYLESIFHSSKEERPLCLHSIHDLWFRVRPTAALEFLIEHHLSWKSYSSWCYYFQTFVYSRAFRPWRKGCYVRFRAPLPLLYWRGYNYTATTFDTQLRGKSARGARSNALTQLS